MTLDQIDHALSEWQAKLALAGSSLLELDDSPAYQRLRGSADRPAVTLTGLTQARVGPAVSLIDGLWLSQQQLTDLVAQAQSLRPALGRLWAHNTERTQIEFLLFGDSVPLPPVEAPFAQRGLLSVPEQARAITAEQLLTQMTQNFLVVKDAVLALGSAWERLGQVLAAADRETAALQSLAGELGADIQPSLDAAQREIAALHQSAATDPLGAGADFTSDLSVLLARMQAQLTDLKQQRDQIDADLRRAQALLLELGALQQSCSAALSECRDKIDALPEALPALPPDLSGWLQRVAAARQKQQWKPAQVGLQRWLAAADSARVTLTEFVKTRTAALERREELRGLLRALQAKAAAQAAHGTALDSSLPALASEAEQLLHGGPTPLDRAAALVSEYEQRLTGKNKG